MSLIDTVNRMEKIDAARSPMERCAGRVYWDAIRRQLRQVDDLATQLAKAHAYLDMLGARSEGGDLQKRVEHIHRKAEAQLAEAHGRLERAELRHLREIGQENRLRLEAEARLAEAQGRLFPIQGGPAIPWSVISPFEDQAQRNHDQSLQRLAERGGLGPEEAISVLTNTRYGAWAEEYVAAHDIPATRAGSEQIRRAANARLLEIVRERQANPRAEQVEATLRDVVKALRDPTLQPSTRVEQALAAAQPASPGEP
jgi:hypothetical protein